MCVSWKDGLCVTEVKVNFGVDIAESRNNIIMTFVYHCTDLFLMIFFDDAIITIEINKTFTTLSVVVLVLTLKYAYDHALL